MLLVLGYIIHWQARAFREGIFPFAVEQKNESHHGRNARAECQKGLGFYGQKILGWLPGTHKRNYVQGYFGFPRLSLAPVE